MTFAASSVCVFYNTDCLSVISDAHTPLRRPLSLLFYLTGSTLSVTSAAMASAKLDCLCCECLHVPFMAEIPCDFNSPDTAQPCSTV